MAAPCVVVVGNRRAIGDDGIEAEAAAVAEERQDQLQHDQKK
jgi:hypothetical protein